MTTLKNLNVSNKTDEKILAILKNRQNAFLIETAIEMYKEVAKREYQTAVELSKKIGSIKTDNNYESYKQVMREMLYLKAYRDLRQEVEEKMIKEYQEKLKNHEPIYIFIGSDTIGKILK